MGRRNALNVDKNEEIKHTKISTKNLLTKILQQISVIKRDIKDLENKMIKNLEII